ADDGGLRLARGSLDVGVFDAEDESAVLSAGEQPVEQRGARVADVELPGGAGCETDSQLFDLTNAIAWTAIASPRPSSPTPSLVFPLMLTRSAEMPSAAATFAVMASIYGNSFGRSAMTDASTLPIS